MSKSNTCPNCSRQGMRIFHTTSDVPSNSCILLETPEAAHAYPRGDIALGYCAHCSFIGNTAFRPELTEYSGRYEETQGYSATFQSFHRDLGQRLVERFNLKEKDLLEIGCGKGEFLLMLCEGGRNRGVGFDPAYRPDRHAPAPGEHVEFVRDFYSENYKDVKADFICCKMTLEHIQPTGSFLSTVRRAIGLQAVDVFFMIPETTRILEDCAFEDIYYEHVSYFTPRSLHQLFVNQGFTVLEIANEYDGQYLTISATTRPESSPGIPSPDSGMILRLVDAFPDAFARKVAFWRDRLADLRARGRRAVIWGSGSKGVAFLTTLGLDTEAIAGAVDINPHRHGYYMPGSGHRIHGPGDLAQLAPDCVIVMNDIYREEIGSEVVRQGVTADILTLLDA